MIDLRPRVGRGRQTLLFDPCGEPAPLVVNGGQYAACGLDKGHGGQHLITIHWGPRNRAAQNGLP